MKISNPTDKRNFAVVSKNIGKIKGMPLMIFSIMIVKPLLKEYSCTA